MADDPAVALLQGPCAPFVLDAEITDQVVCRKGSGDSTGATTAQLHELRAAATDIVWVLLGRPNIGVCEVTVYPCQKCHAWRWWAQPARIPGDCAGCREGCAIRLDMPVVTVSEVVVDGAPIDPSEYYLQDEKWLVRNSGSWPGGAVGDDYADFSITYSFGEVVTALVRDATLEVVSDLWDTRPGAGNLLPPTSTSTSRQGISINVEAEVERVQRVGMNLANLTKAVQVYNPLHQPFPSMAWSPDEQYRSRAIRTFP